MYGLVLEGGGAKGSYHAGVYKAILEEGIEIKAVAGTSIGALNGAMIVQGDYEANLDLWNDISYTDIIQANEEEIERLLNTKLDLEDLKLLSKKIISLVTDRGFDISPFKEMINRYLDEEKLRSSPMDFGIVTINLTDRVPVEVFLEDIPKGKVGDYLLASSYVPIFKLEKLDGKIYLDGGFYDNLPFRMLQRKGYKDLILVRTHSKGIIRRPAKGRGSMIVISPSRDIGRSFICDKEQAKTNIKMGYHDALKVFRGLQGKMYYIEAEDEDYYLDYLLNLNEAKIKAILDQLNISSQPSKRILLEHIVPKLGSIMGLREDFTYGEFVIELLEKKAAQLSIEEYKIYAFEDLLKLVRNAEPIELKVVEDSTLEKIIKKVDLVKYFNKEEAILKIVNIILLA